jgi:hypothetical protein
VDRGYEQDTGLPELFSPGLSRKSPSASRCQATAKGFGAANESLASYASAAGQQEGEWRLLQQVAENGQLLCLRGNPAERVQQSLAQARSGETPSSRNCGQIMKSERYPPRCLTLNDLPEGYTHTPLYSHLSHALYNNGNGEELKIAYTYVH